MLSNDLTTIERQVQALDEQRVTLLYNKFKAEWREARQIDAENGWPRGFVHTEQEVDVMFVEWRERQRQTELGHTSQLYYDIDKSQESRVAQQATPSSPSKAVSCPREQRCEAGDAVLSESAKSDSVQSTYLSLTPQIVQNSAKNMP